MTMVTMVKSLNFIECRLNIVISFFILITVFRQSLNTYVRHYGTKACLFEAEKATIALKLAFFEAETTIALLTSGHRLKQAFLQNPQYHLQATCWTQMLGELF